MPQENNEETKELSPPLASLATIDNKAITIKMDEDPRTLSDEDLDLIVAYMQKQRLEWAAGEKEAKTKGTKNTTANKTILDSIEIEID